MRKKKIESHLKRYVTNQESVIAVQYRKELRVAIINWLKSEDFDINDCYDGGITFSRGTSIHRVHIGDYIVKHSSNSFIVVFEENFNKWYSKIKTNKECEEMINSYAAQFSNSGEIKRACEFGLSLGIICSEL